MTNNNAGIKPAHTSGIEPNRVTNVTHVDKQIDKQLCRISNRRIVIGIKLELIDEENSFVHFFTVLFDVAKLIHLLSNNLSQLILTACSLKPYSFNPKIHTL